MTTRQRGRLLLDDILEESPQLARLSLTERRRVVQHIADTVTRLQTDSATPEEQAAMMARVLEHIGPGNGPIERMELNHLLHASIELNNTALFAGLLTDPRVDINYQADGRSALSLAIEEGSLCMVKSLLSLQALDLNQKDHRGFTPVWQAYRCVYRRGRTSDVPEGLQKAAVEILLLLVADSRTNVNELLSGRNLLLGAEESANIPFLRALLKRSDLDVAFQEENGNNALHLAAADYSAHSAEFIRILLKDDRIKNNADILNAKNDVGKTPFHIAVSESHWGVVELFLNTKCCDPTALIHGNSVISGANALHIAASKGDLSVLQGLMERLSLNVRAQTAEGFTPLHVAIYDKKIACAEYLWTRSGALFEDLNAKAAAIFSTGVVRTADLGFVKSVLMDEEWCRWAATQCLLHDAIIDNCSIEVFKLLLAAKKFDVNHPHPLPVLHTAVLKDKPEMLKELLADTACDPNVHDASALPCPALALATAQKKIRCVELLLKHPALNWSLQTYNGVHAFYSAIKSQDAGMVQSFLAHPQCDPMMVFPGGETALAMLIEFENVELLKLLLKHPRCRPQQVAGLPVLARLIQKDDAKMLKTFLAHADVDLSAADQEGNICLHWAVKARSLTALKVLLAAPYIQRDHQNHQGKTAYDLAKSMKNSDLMTAFSPRAAMRRR